MRDEINKYFISSSGNIKTLISNISLINTIEKSVNLITDSLLDSKCLFCAGNGGSAADSQHLVAELISKLSRDRDPIRALSLTVDTSILTSISNDYDYDIVFSRQLEALGCEGDVFFGISTSGKSKNILNAFEKARQKKIKTILLTGEKFNLNFESCDIVVRAPGKETSLIQEAHLIIYHIMCFMIEKKLVEKNFINYRD